MGKNRNLFKRIRDTKGKFHAKMGTIKDRNYRVSLVAQRLKCLPPLRETWVQSLCWEDPLEKEMATQSSILAWRIPWTEEPGRLQSVWLQYYFWKLYCLGPISIVDTYYGNAFALHPLQPGNLLMT